MNIPRLLLLCSVPLLSAAPVAAQQTSAPTSTPSTSRAVFMNPEGKSIGSATLTETPSGVLISVELTGLPPGVHGFHFHELGRCDPATGFESAGGHYNPGAARHGYMVDGGPHAGDMPNQTVEQDGILKAEVFNSNVTFSSGRAPLFDQDGSALVVHATADDHRSQPSGNAGSRLACAVIQR
jgi:Cu-Zn family superoxide dismutase